MLFTPSVKHKDAWNHDKMPWCCPPLDCRYLFNTSMCTHTTITFGSWFASATFATAHRFWDVSLLFTLGCGFSSQMHWHAQFTMCEAQGCIKFWDAMDLAPSVDVNPLYISIYTHPMTTCGITLVLMTHTCDTALLYLSLPRTYTRGSSFPSNMIWHPHIMC